MNYFEIDGLGRSAAWGGPGPQAPEATRSRTFAYARVSTETQLTENQKEQIAAAGDKLEPRRFVEETISGSVQAQQRPGLKKRLERLAQGDTLIGTKFDRIGRADDQDDGRRRRLRTLADHRAL